MVRTYVFNALAFLPYDRDDQQCRPNGNIIDVGYRNLNFFVLYANESSTNRSQEAWDNLKDRKDARNGVLDHVFTKGAWDLCGRLDAALKKHSVDTDAFGGVAAVKCGYKFVWYQLGYAYFYAAYSSTDYKWEKKGGAYDSKCGQIFFFP